MTALFQNGARGISLPGGLPTHLCLSEGLPAHLCLSEGLPAQLSGMLQRGYSPVSV